MEKEINELDYCYEMSDDPELYIRESYKKDSIEFRLNKLSEEERLAIFNKLNIIGRHNWERYFNKQTELA